MRRLLDKVERRTHKDLLDRRTERRATGRRFVRGDRYQDLAPEQVAKAHAAFAPAMSSGSIRNINKLAITSSSKTSRFRIAGTWQLGRAAHRVLTRGKGELDSRWIFDYEGPGDPGRGGRCSEAAP